ncbi:hypothetical protein D3C86_1160710 [compost metagenome]
MLHKMSAGNIDPTFRIDHIDRGWPVFEILKDCADARRLLPNLGGSLGDIRERTSRGLCQFGLIEEVDPGLVSRWLIFHDVFAGWRIENMCCLQNLRDPGLEFVRASARNILAGDDSGPSLG